MTAVSDQDQEFAADDFEAEAAAVLSAAEEIAETAAADVVTTAALDAEIDAELIVDAAVIEIDLADIKEPIVCCPNDPDDAKFLSEVAGTKIDESFIGSCMTNIGHFRAASKLMEVDAVLAEARRAKANGADRFCMGAARSR